MYKRQTKYFSKKECDFNIDVDTLIETINKDNYELIVICNPNNPTGFTRSEERRVGKEC